MIEVSELSKTFGPVCALDRVTFEAQEGTVLGFLGPNGAGKSTTMRILTGFLPGDSGLVKVGGFDVRTDSLQVRRILGFLPEGVPMYPEMRVREYLSFRARLKGIPRGQRKAQIGESLQAVDLNDVSGRIIGTLSRGYRQRVGLADALLARPRVLILDEPTVGLDPEQVRQFRQVLRDVGRDRTVILSTHILSEVELVCSHVVIINKGRIVARDTAQNLRKRFGSAERTVVEVCGPREAVEAALRGLPGVERLQSTPIEPGPARAGGDVRHGYHRYTLDSGRGEDLREVVFRAVAQGGWLVRELRRESRSLEDTFVEIVGGARP